MFTIWYAECTSRKFAWFPVASYLSRESAEAVAAACQRVCRTKAGRFEVRTGPVCPDAYRLPPIRRAVQTIQPAPAAR